MDDIVEKPDTCEIARIRDNEGATMAADLKYRPFDHDDWGMIRNADGTMYATVRRPEAYEGEFDQHRAEETDPFAEIARKVIFFDHLEAENSALRSDNARLAKELEEVRKTGMEEAAKVADDAADGRRWQKSDASAHNDMRAARDFETMMMEAIQIAAAIRHKATVTTDDLPEGGSET